MTKDEFSNEFDVLYNNVTSNQAPGLDEYEKSVFLTKAQDEILKAYFSPRTNKLQEGFDDNERRQIDFSSITTVKDVTVPSVSSISSFDPRGIVVDDFPTDALMILNEQLVFEDEEKITILTVVPINYTEYSRLMSKPYKRPLKRQAWRLLVNDVSNKAHIITGPNSAFTKYIIRYIRRPKPIILDVLDDLTLGGGKTFDGNDNVCELDPILHHEILQRAVELAKAAYTGSLGDITALGQTSQTSIGAITQSR